MAKIQIYGDQSKGCIFFDGSTVEPKFLGTIQASEHPTETDRIVIVRTDRFKSGTTDFRPLFRRLKMSRIEDNSGQELVGDLGLTRSQVINYINTEAQTTGSSVAGQAPVITSSTAVPLTIGDTLNYELTADYGVGYEWAGLPSGLVPVDGNVRKLIGGSGLAAGSYAFTAKAVNYFGEDTKTINVTVSNPPFQDSKSVQFLSGDYLGANAGAVESVMGRAGNGRGSADAWTLSYWFKAPVHQNNKQTMFYFGDNDEDNGGRIRLRFVGSLNSFRLDYGSNNNGVIWSSPHGVLPSSVWKHVVVSYDGGTTGSSSGDVSDYYSRFKVFVDGVDITGNGGWSHDNYGYSAGIDADLLRIGRGSPGDTIKPTAYVDEVAIWNSDQSSDISSIYNAGVTHDLSLLSEAPAHWWRMGDGDSYPYIQDTVGSAHFQMYSMTAASIVSDVP